MKTRAFTLVELLASSAVLAVLMLAAATCLQLTLRSTARFQRQAELQRQVRLTVSVLSRDFRHAIISDDTPLWLNPPPNLVSMPDRAADGDAVFFFTNNPAAGKSELCATGYYLSPARQLRRYFKNSDAAWQSADGQRGWLPHSVNPAAPLFPTVNVAAENETLMAGVSSFRVRALREDGSPETNSPLTVRPALWEIIFNLRQENFTHEFVINIPGR